MIVEIRPGEGGEDAELFAAELTSKIAGWLVAEGHDIVVDPANERLMVIAVKEPAPG